MRPPGPSLEFVDFCRSLPIYSDWSLPFVGQALGLRRPLRPPWRAGGPPHFKELPHFSRSGCTGMEGLTPDEFRNLGTGRLLRERCLELFSRHRLERELLGQILERLRGSLFQSLEIAR